MNRRGFFSTVAAAFGAPVAAKAAPEQRPLRKGDVINIRSRLLVNPEYRITLEELILQSFRTAGVIDFGEIPPAREIREAQRLFGQIMAAEGLAAPHWPLDTQIPLSWARYLRCALARDLFPLYGVTMGRGYWKP